MPPLDEIEATVRACGLTGVQLHSEAATGVAGTAAPRSSVPGLRILRVVHFGPEAAAQAAMIAQDPNVDAVLVDSRTATAVGGTGHGVRLGTRRQDPLPKRRSARKHLVAAGGLTPDNVAEAIATLRPWGVDVVSASKPRRAAKTLRRCRSLLQTRALPIDAYVNPRSFLLVH